MQGNVVDDAAGEFGIDIDQGKTRAHQAGDMHGGFAQSKDRDIQHFAQFVQTGIEDVADHDGIVIFPLGAQTVVHDIGLIQKFEVAVLFGNRPVRAEPIDRNLGSGRRRVIEDFFQHLSVMAVARAARYPKALVKQTHRDPP